MFSRAYITRFVTFRNTSPNTTVRISCRLRFMLNPSSVDFVHTVSPYSSSPSLPLFSLFKGSPCWGLQPMDLFTYVGDLPNL